MTFTATLQCAEAAHCTKIVNGSGHLYLWHWHDVCVLWQQHESWRVLISAGKLYCIVINTWFKAQPAYQRNTNECSALLNQLSVLRHHFVEQEPGHLDSKMFSWKTENPNERRNESINQSINQSISLVNANGTITAFLGLYTVKMFRKKISRGPCTFLQRGGGKNLKLCHW